MLSLRSVGGNRLLFGLLAAVLAPGCEKPKIDVKSVTDPPVVHLVQPQVRSITRIVGQPSFVETYERTSVYPKLTGYIEKWNVDIGDQVKKGDVLATLFVPEVREDWQTKKDTVKLDEERVALSLKSVEVAQADVEAAQARLLETEKILARFQAQVDRWDVEVKRLKREVDKGVVDPQILLESTNQWKESIAARDAADATIQKAKADLLSRKSALAEAKVYVDVCRARVSVAKSDAKRLEAWVGYLTLPAPFDGVISARNANTFDFVLPATGDPTADRNAPHLSPSGKAAPIYVVDRTDIVRIFVDIPEADANYVHGEKDGDKNKHPVPTKAKVLVQAYRDEWIPAVVTRTSWALNVKSRTLRAEVDLNNPGSQILPGMYAYGKVIIERPNVRAVPNATLVKNAEKTYVWTFKDGKATPTEVRTGISDGQWTELNNRQLPPTSSGEDPWTPIDGSEQVIVGDLSILTAGGPVKVAK
ncbi:MAG TPA: biotin/lipoyl-binding protein [Gemmataceae bacterium]|jgi:multidrug efflux pump subunit AcrA (membrane-fusion protein)